MENNNQKNKRVIKTLNLSQLKNKQNNKNKMKKEDFFKVLIDKGILKISGLDKNLISYRIIEYNGKDYKLILTDVKN